MQAKVIIVKHDTILRIVGPICTFMACATPYLMCPGALHGSKNHFKGQTVRRI